MTPADWLVPDWPAPSSVRAIFTARTGGFSQAPWDSFNLGDHVGDVPSHVAANRAVLQQAINSRPVFLKQVHGVGFERISSETLDATAADACIALERGVACTIMVADCLPVLLTNTSGTEVAAAHAGWRSLAGVGARGEVRTQGVLKSVVDAFQVSDRPPAQMNRPRTAPEIIAWLGPCIGPNAFEVGAEVKAAFESRQPGSDIFFTATSQGKYKADLAGLARAQLQTLGITQIYGNDSSAWWCTAGNPSRYFSHRRDAGTVASGGNGFNTTGRMAACVWLV